MKYDFHLPDGLKKFKRKMAVILPKDAGAIITYANIGKDNRVLEIGGGNGFLTYFLARVSREVIVYEKREDAFKILSRNMKMAGLKNVKLKLGDGKRFRERGLDAIVVDIPDAHEVVERAYKALKEGGTFVAYQPNVEQVKETHAKASSTFRDVFVVSSIHYDMRIGERGSRPTNNCLFHTAYLLFARK